MNMVLFDRPLRIDSVYSTPNKLKPDYRDKPDYSRDRPEYRNKYTSRRSMSPESRSVGSKHESRNSTQGRDFPRERNYHQSYDNRRPQQNERNSYRYHSQPDDEEKATRTLFIGNLDVNATEDEIREMFERYGNVEEIDIKKSAKGPYAFVKYRNLDMALKAKTNLNGEYIRRNQCRIGWGKATPSTCLWVGGLGPGVLPEVLSREFDRFGAISKIKWLEGDSFAYVLYESIDAAKEAYNNMKGVQISGADRKLRLDFADVNHMSGLPAPPRQRYEDRNQGGGDYRGQRDQDNYNNRGWNNSRNYGDNRSRNQRDNWNSRDQGNNFGQNERDSRSSNWYNKRDDFERGGNDDYRRFPNQRPGSAGSDGGNFNEDRNFKSRGQGERQSNYVPQDRGNRHYNYNNGNRYPDNRDDREQGPPVKRYRPSTPEERPDQFDNGNTHRESADFPPRRSHSRDSQKARIETAEEVQGLAKYVPVAWSGALVLKNSAFAARMHLLSGDVELVDNLMRDNSTTELPVLRIMQRLRLDQSKLEEVNRRLESAGHGGSSVLLAMPGSTEALEDSNMANNVQQRQLRNLVSYLKQKEAAGVINLPPNPSARGASGVLYAFPPSKFGHNFLLKAAPRLILDETKEDYMIVVVVRTEG